MTDPMQWLLYGESTRCSCAGECGRTHETGGCTVTHPSALVVAPADPAAVAATPLSIPPEEMGVWCRDCRDMAVSESRARHRLRLLTSPGGSLAATSREAAA